MSETLLPAPPAKSPLRVWLIHDWLTGFRGGEKVLLELVRLFPSSRIATLLHVPGTTHPELDARVQRTSFLQQMPGTARGYRNYLPLYPRAIRALKLDADCDLVLSVSHAVAKGITVPAGIPHLCYCNTPMRYIWGMEDHYLQKHSPKRLALKLAAPALQRFDLRNDSVTRFAANSRNVADRIRRFYNRDADVVYPGIDETFYTLPAGDAAGAKTSREDFYLVVSALVPYKRVDLAIAAFQAMPRHRLVVIGGGPDAAKLRALARGYANITLLGRQDDPVLRDHYQRCRAFLFPGEEDFGLTPVEAQACGAPVIAYRAGGVLETVVENQTGAFFDLQEPSALRAAIDRFETSPPCFSADTLRDHALQFTWQHFRTNILRIVAEMLANRC